MKICLDLTSKVELDTRLAQRIIQYCEISGHLLTPRHSNGWHLWTECFLVYSFLGEREYR